MIIKALALQNFRNFTMRSFDFTHGSLLVGDNGIGKSSVIEALYLLATAESFRAGKVEEMIRLGAELGRVRAKVKWHNQSSAEEEEVVLEVMLTRGVVQGKRAQSRLFSVNDVRRRRKDFLPYFKAVVFRPEDLRLVEGSPSRRRSFLDETLGMVYPVYQSALSRYEQVLKRRNRLLQRITEGREQRSSLPFWDTNLLRAGEILQQQRADFVDFIRQVMFPFDLDIEYLPSLISESRMHEYLEREIIVGHSLIGPHKDDFELKFSQAEKKIDHLSLLAYGSRGQQRLGVLWLKLAQLQFLTARIGYRPVLLLDDIFSELDAHSKDMVLSLIDDYQTVMSTADLDVRDELVAKIPKLKLFNLGILP